MASSSMVMIITSSETMFRRIITTPKIRNIALVSLCQVQTIISLTTLSTIIVLVFILLRQIGLRFIGIQSKEILTSEYFVLIHLPILSGKTIFLIIRRAYIFLGLLPKAALTPQYICPSCQLFLREIIGINHGYYLTRSVVFLW